MCFMVKLYVCPCCIFFSRNTLIKCLLCENKENFIYFSNFPKTCDKRVDFQKQTGAAPDIFFQGDVLVQELQVGMVKIWCGKQQVQSKCLFLHGLQIVVCHLFYIRQSRFPVTLEAPHSAEALCQKTPITTEPPLISQKCPIMSEISHITSEAPPSQKR